MCFSFDSTTVSVSPKRIGDQDQPIWCLEFSGRESTALSVCVGCVPWVGARVEALAEDEEGSDRGGTGVEDRENALEYSFREWTLLLSRASLMSCPDGSCSSPSA